jgi:hypothetical protein
MLGDTRGNCPEEVRPLLELEDELVVDHREILTNAKW